MHLVCNIEQDMDADLLEKGSLPKKKCGNIEWIRPFPMFFFKCEKFSHLLFFSIEGFPKLADAFGCRNEIHKFNVDLNGNEWMANFDSDMFGRFKEI